MLRKTSNRPTERGEKAGFDRRTGEVSGSGVGIGNPESNEDYADDLAVGSGSERKAGEPSNTA
jgi:hypothetical protein